MERILFVTSTRIGDAVLSSGLLAHLIATRPEARFTVAVGPLAAPLFRAAPRVDEIIVMAKRKSGGHWLDLWRRTVGRSWDTVVDLRGSRTSWFLLAKSRCIAGRPRTDAHKVVEASAILKLDPPADPTVWLDAAAQAEADAHVGPAGDGAPFLALSPAASAPFKEWPPERFAELARALTASDGPLPGARVVLFGGPGDEATARAVISGLGGVETLDLTGRLDLVAAAAILPRARLFVGNDSGLMHLAVAAGAPTLGLFGPTDERVYGPWGAHGHSVRAGEGIRAKKRDRLKAAKTTLMGDLAVDAVVAAAERVVADT